MPGESTAWRPKYNPWIIALTVTLATFMEVLDTSIANVALPHIAGGLSASQDESTWVLTSYLVSNAIVLPISAWLSVLVGRKRFYMTCVAAVHHQFFPVRTRAVARNAGVLPHHAGSGRRRACHQRAGDSRRHVYARKARHGVCGLRHGGGAGARDRPDARRLDHRQLQLALDFLHQRAGRV